MDRMVSSPHHPPGRQGHRDAAVETAQKLLDTLPGEVVNSVRHKDDQTACDVARLRILDALEALR